MKTVEMVSELATIRPELLLPLAGCAARCWVVASMRLGEKEDGGKCCERRAGLQREHAKRLSWSPR
jgi:hypothetical protein